jgi:hypothetical protein
MIFRISIYIIIFGDVYINFFFFCVRGGKQRRYLSWEKIRDFIVKQNDARGDAFGMDYYDQKAKDLVKKYTQHDKHLIQKGSINHFAGVF